MDNNTSDKLEKLARQAVGKYSHWLGVVSILAALIAWELIARLSGLPPFILPSPLLVWQNFLGALGNGTLFMHTWVTLQEILLGLFFGVVFATCVGYLIAKSRLLEQFLSPYLVASQAVPIVAVAPLLIIWFGPGMFSKILICALIVFFPVLVNTVVGVRAVPKALHDLMASLRASRWQTLRYLEIPAALPIFLGGLRIGATLSVIGAIVGELIGSDRGLGAMITIANNEYKRGLVFVAIFTLIALALSLYGIIVFIEHRLLAWQENK